MRPAVFALSHWQAVVVNAVRSPLYVDPPLLPHWTCAQASTVVPA